MILAVPVQIALNLTKLTTISNFSANISSDSSQIMSTIVSQGNMQTGGYLSFFIMLAITIILYFTLSDKTPESDFGFTDLRALSISLLIASIFGLLEIELGYVYNFKSVAQFLFMYMLSSIALQIQENKE